MRTWMPRSANSASCAARSSSRSRVSGLGLGSQGLAFDLGVGETRLMLGQFLVQRLEAGLGFLARGAQVFLVGRDFLQVLAQARGALAGLLGLLLQARMLELDVARGA